MSINVETSKKKLFIIYPAENDNDDSLKTEEGFKMLESVGLTEDRKSTGKLQILASMFVFSQEGGGRKWS